MPASYQNQIPDHLGLVSGMFDELGIGDIIDQNARKRQVSVDQAVKALVLNGLGFVKQQLYLVPSFFDNKPTGRLIGAEITSSPLSYKRGQAHGPSTHHQRHPPATDIAHRMQWLVIVQYLEAEIIHVILDNLNTHGPGSLYEAFVPTETRRLMEPLEFHDTPKHGSWLNMAEIELSVLQRQCLHRKIADEETLTREVAAWERHRNATLCVFRLSSLTRTRWASGNASSTSHCICRVNLVHTT